MATIDEHGDALILHLHETGTGDVDEFLASRGLGNDEPFRLVKYLDERGLVDAVYEGGGSIQCALSGAGAHRAEELIRTRPRRRKAMLRCRMLEWLEEHPDAQGWDDFLASDQAHYDGITFTEDQLAREAKYLYDSGYIHAQTINEAEDGMVVPRLTAAGQDYLDNLTEPDSEGSAAANNFFGPVFNAPVTNPQIAWTNTTAHQAQQAASDEPDKTHER